MQLHRQFSWGRWHIGLGRYHQSPPLINLSFQHFAQSNQASTGLEWKVSDSVLIGGDIWVKHSTDKWYVDPTGVTLVVDEDAVGGETYVTARWDRWDGRIMECPLSIRSYYCMMEICIPVHFHNHSL